ncbi:hypothetical protein J6590_081172 [Homalodisca vitripennis]|nr:hypothetical protein J6590_081172 [Homalodisca vitripennis]
MWIVVYLAISIIATASGYVETQPYWGYQIDRWTDCHLTFSPQNQKRIFLDFTRFKISWTFLSRVIAQIDGQGYPGNPSYNTWSAPTGNQGNGLLQMVSRLCPNCLQSGGIDEVSGIPGLRNAIEYSYFNTIKPSMNEMFSNFGIDRGAAYRYADSLCNKNSQIISFLPGNDVVDMLCSDIHQTVQQENL